GEGVRLRVRLGPGADRDRAARHPGHPDALGRRPPRSLPVLMRVPLSWLRDYVVVNLPVRELANRLTVSCCIVERIVTHGVPDEDGNLGRYRVGRVVEAGKHPNADRLQLCRV